MPAEKYTAANDNHAEKYQQFTSRLGQFMRGERTAPASMSDEEWVHCQRVSEGRELCRSAALAARRVRSLSFFSGMHGSKKAVRHAA